MAGVRRIQYFLLQSLLCCCIYVFTCPRRDHMKINPTGLTLQCRALTTPYSIIVSQMGSHAHIFTWKQISGPPRNNTRSVTWFLNYTPDFNKQLRCCKGALEIFNLIADIMKLRGCHNSMVRRGSSFMRGKMRAWSMTRYLMASSSSEMGAIMENM